MVSLVQLSSVVYDDIEIIICCYTFSKSVKNSKEILDRFQYIDFDLLSKRFVISLFHIWHENLNHTPPTHKRIKSNAYNIIKRGTYA